MVSTRNHPKNFPPPPEASPPRSDAGSAVAVATTASPASKAVAQQPRKRRSVPNRRHSGWVHAPSHLTVIWLFVSLPLVAWDVAYMLGRPHTMPGGRLHDLLWKPYALYGTIDFIYGWPAWRDHNGFAGAQSWMNVVESLFYVAYLYIVLQHGRDDGRTEGRGATVASLGWFGRARIVGGQAAGVAAVIGFSAAVMTLSKTVLYVLQEACSGWRGIGHNDLSTLIPLWIIPNGAWIVVPIYMTYVFGAEILDGLAAASGADSLAPRTKSE